ncbi:hypothetical protein E2542_SST09406 [Spatholobus suberectus]|nr:hypothetical protein E2542_SST09406 [Spatholobus suberectus]
MNSLALSSFLMPLFIFTTFSPNTFSSYASHVSYTDHRASVVPNSIPNESKFKVFPHESSGKFCMVVRETGDSPQLQRLEVVPKLYNVVNSRSTISTLVTGSLESMSSEHESYWGDANQLPYVVSLKALICSDVKQRVKVLIGFGNYDSGYRWSFNPNDSLLGEGWWDDRKNQLCINACRFLGMEEPVASAHVGDCSTGMSLKFPKFWSMNGASSIVGQIWSNKCVGDSGYFNRMIVRSHQDKRNRVCGIKYEYSQLDKVRKMCPRQKPLKNKGIRYPDVYSSDTRIDMGVEYYGPDSCLEINVSTKGIYDAEAGSLCMVGCRNLGSQNQIPTTDSVNCEIIVNFQFQQLKAKNDGAYITGSIESTHKNSDPLYFYPLNLTSCILLDK